VGSVADFAAGQTITIDVGGNVETATINSVGTAGATTASAATSAGASVIPVASAIGFSAGQTITVDGENPETAVIAATAGGGRGGSATITVNAPLKSAHASGATIAGSGITLRAALARAHDSGAQGNSGVPTPGGPNHYERPKR